MVKIACIQRRATWFERGGAQRLRDLTTDLFAERSPHSILLLYLPDIGPSDVILLCVAAPPWGCNFVRGCRVVHGVMVPTG
jgi:hypothetical protein